VPGIKKSTFAVLFFVPLFSGKSLVTLAVLAGRFPHSLCEEVDQAAAGAVADLLRDLGDRHAGRQQEGLGVFDPGVDHIIGSRNLEPADQDPSVG